MPASLRRAVVWWKSEAWPLGRWLLLAGTLYNVAAYVSVLALAAILGSSDYGGLRAVLSLFAPLTLIGPAIALPALPLISRVIATSQRRARTIAWQIAGVTTLATAVYVVILYSLPNLLSFVFGPEFGEFRSIMVPIAVAQLLGAPGVGLTLLLIAQQRGRTLVWVSALTAFSGTAISIALALSFGLEGAAWAGAVSATIGAIAVITALYQPRRSFR